MIVTPPALCGLVGGLKTLDQEDCMSLHSHLEELRKKHAAIDERIEDEQRHPGADDLNIKQLKVQKLHLKEEISRLSGQI
jgi:hypothetical protein